MDLSILNFVFYWTCFFFKIIIPLFITMESSQRETGDRKPISLTIPTVVMLILTGCLRIEILCLTKLSKYQFSIMESSQHGIEIQKLVSLTIPAVVRLILTGCPRFVASFTHDPVYRLIWHEIMAQCKF